MPPRKKIKEGRPTKYEKRFCQMLIEHMAAGYSFESFAGLIEVSRAVLYDWLKVQPDFLDAKRIAADKNLLFWEKQGIDGMWTDGSTKFNSTAWIFNLKNRFGWQDRKEETDNNKIHTVKIELPGQRAQQVISVEPKKLDDGENK